MFERFTDRARRVVVLAQQEARLLDHDHIGTEHVLLGLIEEGEGVAAQALGALGIHLEAVRARVGRGEATPSSHIPFTPRARKILELSLREALQLGHNHIGTEHLLLGLVQVADGVAAGVLVDLGADQASVRQQVIRILTSRGTVVAEGVRIDPASTAPRGLFGAGMSRPVAGRGAWPRPAERLHAAVDDLVLRRFTVASWRVLLLAESEALRLGTASVQAEHLLLGLLAEGEGDAARALGEVGVDLERVRGLADKVLGGPPLAGPGRATYGATALDALERALSEALGAGREHIDTGDLLLGLVRQAELGIGLMPQAIDVLGTTPEAVRGVLAAPAEPPDAGAPPSADAP